MDLANNVSATLTIKSLYLVGVFYYYCLHEERGHSTYRRGSHAWIQRYSKGTAFIWSNCGLIKPRKFATEALSADIYTMGTSWHTYAI